MIFYDFPDVILKKMGVCHMRILHKGNEIDHKMSLKLTLTW